MTFEEMFQQAKNALAKANAAKVTEHIAVQFNVTGAGEGIFYAEISDGKLTAEPYDYKDNDAVLTADSAVLLAALKNADTAALCLEGNDEKIAAFRSVLATLPAPKKTETKTAAAKKTETKAAAAKKTETKTTAAKKTVTKAAAAKPAAKTVSEAPKAETKTAAAGRKSCGRKAK